MPWNGASLLIRRNLVWSLILRTVGTFQSRACHPEEKNEGVKSSGVRVRLLDPRWLFNCCASESHLYNGSNNSDVSCGVVIVIKYWSSVLLSALSDYVSVTLTLLLAGPFLAINSE